MECQKHVEKAALDLYRSDDSGDNSSTYEQPSRQSATLNLAETNSSSNTDLDTCNSDSDSSTGSIYVNKYYGLIGTP